VILTQILERKKEGGKALKGKEVKTKEKPKTITRIRGRTYRKETRERNGRSRKGEGDSYHLLEKKLLRERKRT